MCVCVRACVCVRNLHPLPERKHCGGQVLGSVSHTVSASRESRKKHNQCIEGRILIKCCIVRPKGEVQ